MTETKPNKINIKREKKRQPKVPKRITETYLHNSGLYYLERYSTSSHNFRQVMIRKVRKSCFHHQDQNFEDCTKLVDQLVEKFLRSGLLNDQLYLDGMVHSYRRRGLSTRMISQKLIQKGLNESDIEQALRQCDREMLRPEQHFDGELLAAIRFCRSKKLGIYTSIAKAEDENLTNKQLAKMARAGFSYEISRKALDLTKAEIEDLS